MSARASAAPRPPATPDRSPGAAADRFTLTGEAVAINNLAGEALLEPGAGPGVVVAVERRGADAGRLEVATGEIGGRQTLRVIYPGNRIVYRELGPGSSTSTRVREDGTFGGDSRGRDFLGRRVRISWGGGGLEAHADLRISVPRGQQLTLRLACGPVTATNVEGGYNTAGLGEIDTETVALSAVFVESRAAALAPPPSGAVEIIRAIADGAVDETHIRAEIGEVVAGAAAGRISRDEITLYKSVGVAVQDAAAAALVLAKANETGVGVDFRV